MTELLARNAERNNPPVGRSIVVDGVRLHYTDRGHGPAVVLIHGNGLRLQDFIASGLIDRLSATHRVIAFDRPGYGYSERPRNRIWTVAAQASLLHSALQQLGVERPVVLGHSFGALVALAMALDHPADVKKLVLIGGYYYPTARLDVALVAPTALPLVGDILRHTVMPLTSRLMLNAGVRSMFAPMSVPDRFLPLMSREMMVRPRQLRANAEDATAMIPAAAQMQERYRELRLPISIIAGEGDRIVDPEAHAERLHRDVPHSTWLSMPEAGHMVHYMVQEHIQGEIDRVSGTPLLSRAESPENVDGRAAAGSKEEELLLAIQ